MNPVGCLWWVLVVLAVLLVLSALFGGFRKGSQYHGLERPGRVTATAASAAGPGAAVDVLLRAASGTVSY